MSMLDLDNGNDQENVRFKRPRNETLSHQPQKRPSLGLHEQADAGVWHQGTQKSSRGSGSPLTGSELSSDSA